MTAAAPLECSQDSKGNKFKFGAKVPINCCSGPKAPKPSTTKLQQRANTKRGYCNSLPENDPAIGKLGNLFDGLAFCHSKTKAIYGEACVQDFKKFEPNNCQPCLNILEEDVSGGPSCFKANDAPGDKRQWFVHIKGCGCTNSAIYLAVTSTIIVVAASLY